MQQPTKYIVPHGTTDPIGFLLDTGKTLPELAVAWNLKSVDAVYRLRRFASVPSARTARRMADSFGWPVGAIYDLWLSKTEDTSK